MVGRLLSYWEGIFSGAMLNFQGVGLEDDFRFNMASFQVRTVSFREDSFLRKSTFKHFFRGTPRSTNFGTTPLNLYQQAVKGILA